MGGNGAPRRSGLSRWIAHYRRKQRARRAAGAGAESGGAIAADRSRSARFPSQRRTGTIPAARRPSEIRRGIAQGRPARMTATTRRLAAILAADVAGYSPLMGA